MKKQGRIILIILVSLVVVYYIASATGMLSTAVFKPGSNEPNVRSGARIWVSNLVKPERFDFICYKMDKSEYWEGGTWMMRLCGMPHDTIQIIDGILFVNGRDADAPLNLKKEYSLSKEESKKLDKAYFRNSDDIHVLADSSVDASLETDVYKKKSLHGALIIDSSTSGIESVFHQPWSRDNFGPIVVPDSMFFVLGDNRHGAADSRYTGFIDKKRWKGTVISVF